MSHKPNDEVDMRWPLRNFILRILFSCLLQSFLFSVITMKIIAEVRKHGNIAPRHTNVSKGSDVNLTGQITQLYFDYFEKPQGVMLCPKTKAQFQSGPCTLT